MHLWWKNQQLVDYPQAEKIKLLCDNLNTHEIASLYKAFLAPLAHYSGQEVLNRFLSQYALPNQQASASQTYVSLADRDVIGFYSLVVGEVSYDDAPNFFSYQRFATNDVAWLEIGFNLKMN